MRTLLLAFALGCGATTPQRETAGTDTIEIPEGKRRPEVSVELIAVGEGTPLPLRITPRPGQRQHLRIATQMQAGFAPAGQALVSIPIPTMIFDINAEVEKVASNGDFRQTSIVEGFSVEGTPDDPQVAALREQLAPLRGLRSWTITDSRGRVLAADVEAAEELPATMQQSITAITDAMTSISAPIPVEPIAVGATWRVQDQFITSGVHVNRTTQYRLTERTESEFALEQSTEFHAERQRMQSAPDTELLSLTGTASVTQRSYLDGRLLHSESESRTRMQIRSLTESRELEMSFEVASRIDGLD